MRLAEFQYNLKAIKFYLRNCSVLGNEPGQNEVEQEDQVDVGLGTTSKNFPERYQITSVSEKRLTFQKQNFLATLKQHFQMNLPYRLRDTPLGSHIQASAWDTERDVTLKILSSILFLPS